MHLGYHLFTFLLLIVPSFGVPYETSSLEKRYAQKFAAGTFNTYSSNNPFLSYNNGAIKFILQYTDANLVVYVNKSPAFASSAYVQGGCNPFNSCNLIFQNDGNLVIYHGSTPLWSTGTSGIGANVQFADAKPYISVLNSAGASVWNSGVDAPPPGYRPPKCGKFYC